jgi:hypothetical protein
MVVSNFELMKYFPRLRSSVAMAVASAFGVGETASGLDMMGRTVGLPTVTHMSNGLGTFIPNPTVGGSAVSVLEAFAKASTIYLVGLLRPAAMSVWRAYA